MDTISTRPFTLSLMMAKGIAASPDLHRSLTDFR